MNRHPVLALAAVLLAVTAAIAQPPPPDSVPADSTPAETVLPRPSLYDPHNDVFSPSVARGLYAVSLLSQAYIWSWMPPLAFDFSPVSAQAMGAGMLIIGGGVGGGLLATRRFGNSLGNTVLSYRWGTGGIWTGLAAGDLLYDWGQDYSSGIRPQFVTALAGGVAGNFCGYAFADAQRLNGGNALMLSVAGEVGAAYGGLIAVTALNWERAELFPVDRIPWERKLIEVGVLAGQGAGTWLWHRYAPYNWTSGDALSFNETYTLAYISGMAVYLLLTDEYESPSRLALAGAMLVGGGGIAYGYRYHRGRDLTLPHALYSKVSTTLGQLAAGGLTLLVLGEHIEDTESEVMLIPLAIGGWAGFHLGPALARAMPGPSLKSGLMQRVHLCADPATAAVAYAAAKSGAPVRVPVLSVDF